MAAGVCSGGPRHFTAHFWDSSLWKVRPSPLCKSFSPPAGAPGPDTPSSEPSHILIRAFGVLETMSPRDYCQSQPRYYRITVRQSDSWRCPDNYSAAWISVEKLPCRENLSPRDAAERGSGGGWCGEESQRGSEGVPLLESSSQREPSSALTVWIQAERNGAFWCRRHKVSRGFSSDSALLGWENINWAFGPKWNMLTSCCQHQATPSPSCGALWWKF